jgi:uncharacterized protein
MKEQFIQEITKQYISSGPSVFLGTAVLNGEVLPEARIVLPLSTFNRHGLIAGATGTGKTKTLQGIAEALSDNGVPCLLMDIKGDLSGLVAAGIENSKITDRHSKIGVKWAPSAFPVELLTISHEKGTRMRATLSEFGPVLFSRILDLNDTQSGVVSMVFKYCDDHGMPLLDLRDFRKTLQFLTNEGRVEVEEHYGKISKATTATIIRKILEIEQQEAEVFFGERSFDVNDLMRTDAKGRGYLNIVRLTDIQDRPKLFSTFMLCLLAEIYEVLPEAGDLDKPGLAIFIDEAHLVFSEASKALMSQLETVIKLIRSKGVGVFFCTQQPTDIPEDVLAQLGLKVQHALRAFTAKDRKNLKLVAENYPLSDYYKTDELLTSLGIGEAMVTGLNEKGVPTPLAHVMLCAPRSRMDILTPDEMDALTGSSAIASKYNETIDRESAFEILTQKLSSAAAVESPAEVPAPVPPKPPVTDSSEKPVPPAAPKTASRRVKEEKSVVEEVADSVVGRQVARTIAREITRGLFGVLGLGKRRS